MTQQNKYPISLIAAISSNYVLGNDGDIPWHLPKDFAYFKTKTLNKPIIMGRKTFESIGRPLPNRKNIVLTHQHDYQPDGVTVCHTIEDALQLANDHIKENTNNAQEVMIIGGAEIYKLFLPFANTIYLTEIDMVCDGDAHFPRFNQNQWQLTTSSPQQEQSNDQTYHYAFNVYQNV